MRLGASDEMAPRTLRKVYGTLRTLLRDAVIEELIEHKLRALVEARGHLSQ